MVLVINQYLLQAYQIPSPSMVPTLLMGDRIFVNKVILGPELLPGVAKLPGFDVPHRSDVVIFENPSYLSRGTLFTILQRTIYMLTLSLVDIDRDETGEPRAQLLIKRALGVGGDRVRVSAGEIQIRPRGADTWSPADDLASPGHDGYESVRSLTPADYETIRVGARALALDELGEPLDEAQRSARSDLLSLRYNDPFAVELHRQRALYEHYPNDERVRARLRFIMNGWYVPDGRIFPAGDNRDNSRDGRFFGAVPIEDVLGRAMVIYWPFSRLGAIR